MLIGAPKEFRKYSKNAHSLKRILRDTCNALDEISTHLQLGSKNFGI